MKNKHSYKNTGRKAVAFCLIYTMWLICLPLALIQNLQAQTDASKWKMREDKVQTLSVNGSNGKFNGKIAQIADEIFSTKNSADNDTTASQPSVDGERYMFVNVEFTSLKAREAVFTSAKTSRVKGASVLTVIDRFADVYVSDNAAMKQLRENPDVVYIDGHTQVIAPPPPPAPGEPSGVKAVPDQIIRGGYQNLKGKNVVIAVVDSGVDFRHPDFITYDAAGVPTSRLLALWDTGLNYKAGRGNAASFKYPNNAPIGTVFTQEQLTKELRSTAPSIPANDLDGHGTACASIAAGNGNADVGQSGLKRKDVIGVAPEALIIGVSLDTMKKGKLHGAYLINAISEWLDKVAGAKPLVVSNSWGGHYTGHDGQSVAERELNIRYSLAKKGRAILFAAGNEGEDTFHSTINFAGKEKPALVPWSSATDSLETYFDTNDLSDIQFAPAGETQIKVQWREVSPLTKQASIGFEVNPGVGAVYFFSKSGKNIKADLYLPATEESVFHSTVLSRKGLVGTPGTMENAITVGSYDWNDNFHIGGAVTNLYGACSTPKFALNIGDISCYSSPGPTRDGRMKPEIAAPGQYYTSSIAKVDGRLLSKYPDTTGNYRFMNGTSAATPYTAGIVALMFEKKPTLTLGEVKKLLQTNASRDPKTGTTPSSAWGAGKLDTNSIDKIFAAIK